MSVEETLGSRPKGTTVKDVRADDFIKAYSKHLKRQGKIEIPKWVDIVKTGRAQELAPMDPDWYYVKCASIARRVYLRPHIGIGHLSRVYAKRQNNGVAREHTERASTGIIRNILIQLEKIGVLQKAGKGRSISRVGQQDLDRIAGQVREASTA